MVHSRVFQQICLEPIVCFFYITFSILEASPPSSSTSYGATEVPGEPYPAAAACHGAGGRKVGGTAPEPGRVGRRGDGVWVSPTQRWGYPPVSSNVAAGCQGNHEKSSEKMEVWRGTSFVNGGAGPLPFSPAGLHMFNIILCTVYV